MMLPSTIKRALVIGAGSGRDIASATLITQELTTKGIHVDLAGFLTPWAVHLFNNHREKPINMLTKNSKKYILGKENEFLDNYFEPELLNLNKEYHLKIKSFYLLSLHYGTKKLASALQQLVKKNKYDTIIAVDMGGDILAIKKDYHEITTPIVDLTCKYLLATLPKKIKKYLVVVAPGSDGEINSISLAQTLKDLTKKRVVLTQENLYKLPSYPTFMMINTALEKRTTAYSNTIHVIKKHEKKAPLRTRFTRIIMHGKQRKEIYWYRTLNIHLLKHIYYLDFERFYHYYPCHLTYHNILEALTLCRTQGFLGTEVDHTTIPSDSTFKKKLFVPDLQKTL